MKSNEDVDWGVIFSEASVCVRCRHVFAQKRGECYMYELCTDTNTQHFTHIYECTCTHRQKMSGCMREIQQTCSAPLHTHLQIRTQVMHIPLLYRWLTE